MGRKNSENLENKETEVTEVQTEVTEVQTEPTTEVQTEPTTEVQTEPTTEVQTEPTTEETTEAETEPVVEKSTTGMVDNCTRLNIRELPDKASNVLTIVSKGTGLGINLNKSTEDFYCVHVLIDNELVEGYCLKDFIEIR